MEVMAKKSKKERNLSQAILTQAYDLMWTARHMANAYEDNREVCSKYVHSTSRGHEAIQLAAGLQLKEYDFASLYYRDESILHRKRRH